MSLEDQLAAYFQVDPGEGLLITHVRRHSPAEEAGLQAGDVLVRVADRPIRRTRAIERALSGKDGQTVSLQIVRNGQRKDLSASFQDE